MTMSWAMKETRIQTTVEPIKETTVLKEPHVVGLDCRLSITRQCQAYENCRVCTICFEHSVIHEEVDKEYEKLNKLAYLGNRANK